MYNKIVLLALFLLFAVSADANEKYLSLSETEFDCGDHVLFKDRAATVTDITGEKTDLNRMVFRPKDKYYFRFGLFPPCGSAFYILQDTVQLSIPINLLLSLKFNGSKCEVKYIFMDETKTVSGKYLQGDFEGDGDFGAMNIKPGQVQEIVFGEPAPIIKAPVLDSKLILKNGTVIPVREADMVTIDLFSDKYESSMFKNEYHMDTFLNNDSEITFLKGVSTVSVPFKNISKLELFPEKGELSITLKNGKTADGKFTPNDEKAKGTIEGFAGICNEAGFFVPIEHIKEYRSNQAND